MSDRLDRIEALLDQMTAYADSLIRATNGRMTEFDRELAASRQETAERMTEFDRQLAASRAKFEQEMAVRRAEFDQELAASRARLEQEVAVRRVEFDREMAASRERLTQMEQMVASNNRFLEAFSADVTRYIQRMDSMTLMMNGVIATSNQDRQDINSRLGSIQRKVDAIARYHGID